MADIDTPTTPSPSTPVGSSPTAPPIMTFPSDVNDMYHFIKISSFQYTRSARGTLPNNPGYTGHVVLPMPANLLVNYGANWGSAEFTPVQSYALNSNALKNIGQDVRNRGAGPALKQYYDEASSWVKKQFEATKDQKTKEAESNSTDSMIDKINAGAKSFFNQSAPHVVGLASVHALDFLNSGLNGAGGGIATGLARNPHIAVYYTAPELRSHTFAFKLSPKNINESLAVFNIIQFFKSKQAPTLDATAANHLFGYPDEFQITFNNEKNLFKILNCVLRDFTVNYHSQGQPVYFRGTKAPVDVDISLTFQEVAVLTRDLIDQGY